MKKRIMPFLTVVLLLMALLLIVETKYLLFYKTIHESVFEDIGTISIEPRLNSIVENIEAIQTDRNHDNYQRYLLNIDSNIVLCENALEQLNRYYSLYFEAKGDSWGEGISTINDLVSGFRGFKSVIEKLIIGEEQTAQTQVFDYAHDELTKLTQILHEHSLQNDLNEDEYVHNMQETIEALKEPASLFMIRLNTYTE